LSSGDVPMSTGIIFDTSGSMSDKFEKTRQATVHFVQTANPLDEFCLVTFSQRTELTSGFTSRIENLQSRVLSAASRRRVALFDANQRGPN
jgi:Ca-activated chloride channel homolog